MPTKPLPCGEVTFAGIPAPRPRVEGEAVNLSLLTEDERLRAIATAPIGADLAIVVTALVADRDHWRNGYEQLQQSFDDLWARLNAELARTTRLTAEVERLRGQQSKVVETAITETYRECARCEFPDGFAADWNFDRKKVKSAIYAALSLPTPAPEGTDG